MKDKKVDLEKGWDDNGEGKVFSDARLKTDPIVLEETVVADSATTETFMDPTYVPTSVDPPKLTIRVQGGVEIAPHVYANIDPGREAMEYLENLIVICKTGGSVALGEMQKLKELLS